MSSVFLKLTYDKYGSNKTEEDIKINSTTKSAILAKILGIDAVNVSATNISYNMHMYEPDHFTADIEVKANGLSMSSLAESLIGLYADIKYVDSDKKEQTLSENLFIYQAIPSIVNNSNDTISVRLEIYSIDKLLDLQKFSQAFTGQSIGNIMSEDTLNKYVPKDDDNGKCEYSLTMASNKQILEYKINGKAHEVIQPYLAQYNETFRSLLNRTTNRCGEFLYWRNGALQYGLHSEQDNDAITVEQDTATITMSTLSNKKFETLNVKATHRNGKKDADFTESGAVNYDLETGMPDFNETVKFVYGSGRKYSKEINMGTTFGLKYVTDTNDDKYGGFDSKKCDRKKYLIGDFLTKYAKTGNFINFISDIMVDILVTKPISNLHNFEDSDDAKQAINHKRLISKDKGDTHAFKVDEQTNFASDWSKDDQKYTGKASSVEDYDKLQSNLKISPFSTLGAIIEDHSQLLDNKVLSSAFYQRIRNKGQETAERSIDITMLSNALPTYIGQRIKVKDVVYVVTGISGLCKSAEDGTTASGEPTYLTETTIHAIPSTKVNDVAYFLPEPLPEQNRKMDGNSTAYIMDTDDPYGQGRVRLRFSWQGLNEVELPADQHKKCYDKALNDVYKKGSTSLNQKEYDDDKNNTLYVYRDDFKKEILEGKKNKSDLKAFEKKMVQDDDEINVYNVDGRYYPKSIADKKAAEISKEKGVEYRAVKVDKINEKKTTYAMVSAIIKRISKVEDNTQKYEESELEKLERTENLKDSTPWIRMASPMAGNATFYMKPSVGDEVIVGFENGNPERPYVLGSLFNGSSQSPSGFGVTMANGHGIKLEDEDMSGSDLIGTLISPLAKTILDTIDKDKDEDDKMGVSKTLFHVGGKVSIKDKYGFYSLSMSSADRKVDIKCPLGNISLSAFTGITISAPNGDINIKGKNVNISAGDRITLTSGTNKDIMDSDLSDFGGIITSAITKAASAAIDVCFGDIKAIDLSVVRSMWEVIFRPINGSLAITSKRHLMLQAGKGKVEMPVDTIQTSKPSLALAQFPNYPFYLMQDFMEGLDNEHTAKLSALENAFNSVCLAVSRRRDKVNEVDKDPRPNATDYLNATRAGATAKELKSVLTEEKLLQIFSGCIKEENKKWVINDANIMKFCPFPDTKNHKDDVEAWKTLVTSTAQKVANLKNIYQNITNWKFRNEPAVKAFIDTVNASLEKGDFFASVGGGLRSLLDKHAISENDFADLDKFMTDIKIQECKPGSNAVDFDLNNYLGNVDLNKFTISKFTAKKNLQTRQIQYSVLKVLKKLELISLVIKEETVVPGTSKYHTRKLPEYVDINSVYDSWSNFLKHIVPSDSITDLSSHYIWSAIGGFVKGLFNDILTDAVDYENLNWMFGSERRVWNTKAHPGLILMSSENGSTTAVLGKDSKLTQSNNHSLKSLLSNMAAKNARPDIQMGTSVADTASSDWTTTI